VPALRAFLAISFLPLTARALPQERVRASPRACFERLSDSGAHGVVTLAFDLRDYADLSRVHGRGAAFRLEGLPLPGGLEAELELRPVSALEPGARAQVVREEGVVLLEPRARCFSGRVVGGGPAFLGVGERALHGYFYTGDGLYFLSSGAGMPGRATLAHESQLGTLDTGPCGVDLGAGELQPTGGGSERATLTPSLRTAPVFIEADNAFRARFASDQECVDYTALLLTAASEIYRRDIGTRLTIPDRYLRVWNTTPPWGTITGYNNLKNVYTWWQSTQNPLRSLPRAAVHVLTHPIFGGTSRGVDGLCSTTRAYEISSLAGQFPYPRRHTDRYNWDLFVVCHEFGHTFGSPHSHLYLPPIECLDGSGPDSGTLMSYCHVLYGIAKVGMRFHVREQQRIRNASADASCLETQVLAPGDYDGDLDVDASDLAALRAVLGQGFRSLAAEEVFDLDGSGTLSKSDHDLLAELVYSAPPATVAARNGSGVNPACLEALGNPVLGTLWRARILAPGAGSSTLLVGYDLPLDGLPTSRGELLVRTSPYGGTKLFSTTALSDGVAALHELALPLDPSLYGRAVSFQALILDGPSGNQYCNALDAVLSPYE
jgi:hypothetical protein